MSRRKQAKPRFLKREFKNYIKKKFAAVGFEIYYPQNIPYIFSFVTNSIHCGTI